MQSKNILLKSGGLLMIKIVVTLGVVGYLWHHLHQEEQVFKQTLEWLQNIGEDTASWGLLVFIILLVPINWALEAKRWQLIQGDSFFDSFQTVLSALGTGLIAPQYVAELWTRMQFRGDLSRTELTKRWAFNSILLAMVVVLVGGSFLFFKRTTLPISYYFIILFLLIALSFWMIKKLKLVVSPFKQWAILGLTLLRYIVFSSQFVLMLYLSDVPVNVSELIASVSMIYLFKTILPVLGIIAEIGLREATALYFFQDYGVAEWPIVMASFSIWFVNILVPGLLGLVIWWRTKSLKVC